MNAEQIVDKLLEGDEAADFFNQHLLDNPSFVFTGPGSWKPYRSEVGDTEVSQGEKFIGPNDQSTYPELVLWIHPTGLWYFRTTVHWQKTPHQNEWLDIGPHDIYASTPERKLELLNAIQDFIPQIKAIMAKETAPMINGGRLQRTLSDIHTRIFGHMYAWQP